jgi:hypothetical protein
MSVEPSPWTEIEVLRDPDGVICVITEKVEAGQRYHSYALMKEYIKDGEPRRSLFLSRRHTTAARRLLVRLEEWLDQTADRQGAARLSLGR